ncbi:MAG: hypothetical protein SCH71_06515 [Desulfobulbaceae bacterium]|nr:hypothetical protein [Desulfobulbaceae bacterium]
MNFKKIKQPNLYDMLNKSVNDWTINEKLHIAAEYKKLQCNNIECHMGRDVLKSLWDAIHQTPACGLNVILCAAAQEVDALRESLDGLYLGVRDFHPGRCAPQLQTAYEQAGRLLRSYDCSKSTESRS